MPPQITVAEIEPVSKNLKNIGVVSALTMVSRVLGLGRDMLVTAIFGTSALASIFYTAFTLPNLFRRLLGEGAHRGFRVGEPSVELALGGDGRNRRGGDVYFGVGG